MRAGSAKWHARRALGQPAGAPICGTGPSAEAQPQGLCLPRSYLVHCGRHGHLLALGPRQADAVGEVAALGVRRVAPIYGWGGVESAEPVGPADHVGIVSL